MTPRCRCPIRRRQARSGSAARVKVVGSTGTSSSRSPQVCEDRLQLTASPVSRPPCALGLTDARRTPHRRRARLFGDLGLFLEKTRRTSSTIWRSSQSSRPLYLRIPRSGSDSTLRLREVGVGAVRINRRLGSLHSWTSFGRATARTGRFRAGSFLGRRLVRPPRLSHSHDRDRPDAAGARSSPELPRANCPVPERTGASPRSSTCPFGQRRPNEWPPLADLEASLLGRAPSRNEPGAFPLSSPRTASWTTNHSGSAAPMLLALRIVHSGAARRGAARHARH